MEAEDWLGDREKVKENGLRSERNRFQIVPLPVYHGELEKWEDGSRQLKRYVGLHKPIAKMMMDG